MRRYFPGPVAYALLLGAACLLCSPPARSDSAESWALTGLDLDMWLAPGQPVRLEGRATFVLEADSVDGVRLVLPNSAELSFAELRVGMRAFRIEEPGSAYLDLEQVLDRGVEILVEFSGTAPAQIVSEAGTWFSGRPAWHPRSAGAVDTGRNAAPGLARFHLPAQWHAVSVGDPVARVDLGHEVTQTWSCYDSRARAFVVGPFKSWNERWEELDYGLYLGATELERARTSASYLVEAIQVLEDLLGPHPFSRIDLVEFEPRLSSEGRNFALGGIIGVPAATFALGASAGEPEAIAGLASIAHLAAHAWWPASADADRNRTAETLAEFSALLVVEAVVSRDAVDALKENSASTGPECSLGGATSPEGLGILDALRTQVGDERFFDGFEALALTPTRTPTWAEAGEVLGRSFEDAPDLLSAWGGDTEKGAAESSRLPGVLALVLGGAVLALIIGTRVWGRLRGG